MGFSLIGRSAPQPYYGSFTCGPQYIAPPLAAARKNFLLPAKFLFIFAIWSRCFGRLCRQPIVIVRYRDVNQTIMSFTGPTEFIGGPICYAYIYAHVHCPQPSVFLFRRNFCLSLHQHIASTFMGMGNRTKTPRCEEHDMEEGMQVRMLLSYKLCLCR